MSFQSTQQQYNTAVNSVRIVVEWSYADVTNLWAFLSMKKQLKRGLGLLDTFHSVAIFLTNCHTCLRGGNRTSGFFNVAPWTLDEFLAMAV